MGQDVGYRYNPPTGWPTPPAGWAPPPGWVPDPRWPAPPAGWQLWIAGSPATESSVGSGTDGGTPAAPSARHRRPDADDDQPGRHAGPRLATPFSPGAVPPDPRVVPVPSAPRMVPPAADTDPPPSRPRDSEVPVGDESGAKVGIFGARKELRRVGDRVRALSAHNTELAAAANRLAADNTALRRRIDELRGPEATGL